MGYGKKAVEVNSAAHFILLKYKKIKSAYHCMGMHAQIRHKQLFFLDPETKRLSILGKNTPCICGSKHRNFLPVLVGNPQQLQKIALCFICSNFLFIFAVATLSLSNF